MKRILTIAIVVCLAVTMTCSIFAVDDSIIDSSAEVTVAPEADSVNGTVVLCPYCGHSELSIATTREFVDVVYINSVPYARYLVTITYSCDYCGVHKETTYEYVNLS